MTSEHEYIVISNLARVRIFTSILGTLLDCPHISKTERQQVGSILHRWEQRLAERLAEDRLTNAMGEKP